MSASILAIVGALVTGVVVPLVGFFLKRWASGKAEQAELEAKRQAVEMENRKKDQAEASSTQQVNREIDAQKIARERWLSEKR